MTLFEYSNASGAFILYDDELTGEVHSIIAGTGVSVSSATGDVTVTNSAPDQTVALTGGTSISTSGTYPSFTITNDSPNATHTGDVTGSGALTIANDVISYAKLAAEFTTSAAVGATTLDFSTAQVFTKANSGTVTYTITNADTGMVKDLILTGTGSFSITGGKLVAGDFVESTTNFVQVVAQSASIFWYSISQEQ
jgi:hypothetical protein